jgi:hypothetical protein
MSSATLIDDGKPVPEFRRSKGSKRSEPKEPKEPLEPTATEGFRPWHFFLLASLMTATVAVMISRQATPEHLVLISLTIVAAGLAATSFYRMLAPLAAQDLTTFSEPLSERARHALEREKLLVLRSIKELEFDRAMGKLSPKDFDEMSVRLRARAIALMKQLDEGSAGYRELIERELNARLAVVKAGVQPVHAVVAPHLEASPADACAACGTRNDHDAAFCKRCGAQL